MPLCKKSLKFSSFQTAPLQGRPLSSAFFQNHISHLFLHFLPFSHFINLFKSTSLTTTHIPRVQHKTYFDTHTEFVWRKKWPCFCNKSTTTNGKKCREYPLSVKHCL